MTIPTQLVLRALLEDPARELYGVEIGAAAGLPSGTVHPILARLEGLRWVQSHWEDIDTRVEGRPASRQPVGAVLRMPDNSPVDLDIGAVTRFRRSGPRGGVDRDEHRETGVAVGGAGHGVLAATAVVGSGTAAADTAAAATCEWTAQGLPTPPGTVYSWVRASHGRGRFAGDVTGQDYGTHPVVWRDGRLTDLGTPFGLSASAGISTGTAMSWAPHRTRPGTAPTGRSCIPAAGSSGWPSPPG